MIPSPRRALLGLAAACSLALALPSQAANFTATFVPVAAGSVVLDGFGREATPGAERGSFGAAAAPDLDLGGPVQPQGAVREFFRDLWAINTSLIDPGPYTLAPTVINALGTLEFLAVSFRSYDAGGNLQIIDFAINANRTQAVGSGPFTVLASCPVQVCVWIELIGTQLAGVPGEGYGGVVGATLIPEPGSWALMLAGLAGLGALQARARRKRIHARRG